MFELPSDKLTVTAIGLASLAAFKLYSSQNQLRHIPTVGYSWPLLSYITAVQFWLTGEKVVQEGYDRFHSRVFKIANLTRWIAVVSGDELVNELKNAPEDRLSFSDPTKKLVECDYTMGPEIFQNMYHAGVVKQQLTRNLGNLVPELHSEILSAFEESIPPQDSWFKVDVSQTVPEMVCRISNRTFVGVSLCRDPIWRGLNVRFTMDVMKDAMMITMFPEFLKPFIKYLFGRTKASILEGEKCLDPIVTERLSKVAEFGKDYPDKPLDFLSWLIDEAGPEEMNTQRLTLRVLSVNFAAIHTSSMSFTHALYHLAAEPKYIAELREEAEEVERQFGWTRNSVSKLYKIDSFLKESQRMNGIGALVMGRQVVNEPFTFSDGTVLPIGTIVHATSCVHHDDSAYTNSSDFDPWRFSNMREEKTGGTIPMTASTNEFLAFGAGPHACPGRMFAVNELKMMMAHLVMMYDVKLENEGLRPSNFWFGTNCMPNQNSNVLFRKRAVN